MYATEIGREWSIEKGLADSITMDMSTGNMRPIWGSGYPFQGMLPIDCTIDQLLFYYHQNITRSNLPTHVFRPGTRQSTGRCFHQRSSAAQSRSSQDRRNGRCRHSAVRNIATVARLTRLRFEDPQSLPGNGFDTTGRHWWLKAKSRHTRC